MFMVRFLSAQSLVTLRIWGPLKEDRQFVTIFCHKWRYCPVNKIFWAWFVAMLRKGDIWGLVWSNALDRRYFRSDFCTGFAPTNDGTQRTGGGCTLQLLSLLSRGVVGFSFSNRALGLCWWCFFQQARFQDFLIGCVTLGFQLVSN